MKRTKSMIYKHTEESRELQLYVDNTYDLYRFIESVQDNLLKKISKGIYDGARAVDAFYHVACEASKAYNHDFGYAFSVQERYTVAVDLAKEFEDENL